MSFDPDKPVSLEEYNETLSNTYAMTYEHMKYVKEHGKDTPLTPAERYAR